MEPTYPPLDEVIAVWTTVKEVAERFKDVHISGVGKDALFQKVSLGFYIHFEGSYELLYVGRTIPNLKPGDHVKITFQRHNPCPA